VQDTAVDAKCGVLTTLVALVLLAALRSRAAAAQETRCEVHVPYRAITSGPKAHWFGYYDKYQFDPTGRYVLGMEVDFEDRPPRPDDLVRLGMVDLEDGDRWIPLAESRAWCWQQGCMFQWLPGSDCEVIYNDRKGDRFVAVVLNVFTKTARVIPNPVYAVSPDGTQAVSLNFARVGRTRPGYGYVGVADPGVDEAHPDDDGIFLVDLASGESRLVVKLDQMARLGLPEPTTPGTQHWFNHLLFNPDGSRFIFLHRWHRTAARTNWYTRMFTARPDGTGLHCVADHNMVSHFIWRNPREILAWSTEPDHGDRFHLYRDQEDVAHIIGDGVLKTDGHCTYSPDGEWVLTDSYPDRKTRMQPLMLFHPDDGRLVELGKFYLAPVDDVQLRCDLHPRWSRDGGSVCIDSKHSGQRQMYILDVRAIVSAK